MKTGTYDTLLELYLREKPGLLPVLLTHKCCVTVCLMCLPVRLFA